MPTWTFKTGSFPEPSPVRGTTLFLLRLRPQGQRLLRQILLGLPWWGDNTYKQYTNHSEWGRFQLVRESEKTRYEFVTVSRCFRNGQYTNHSEWGRCANKCYVCIHVYIICICIPLGMLHMYTCVYYTYMYTFGSSLVRRKYMACLPEYRDA